MIIIVIIIIKKIFQINLMANEMLSLGEIKNEDSLKNSLTTKHVIVLDENIVINSVESQKIRLSMLLTIRLCVYMINGFFR